MARLGQRWFFVGHFGDGSAQAGGYLLEEHVHVDAVVYGWRTTGLAQLALHPDRFEQSAAVHTLDLGARQTALRLPVPPRLEDPASL